MKKRTRDIIFGDELKRKSARLWRRVKLGLDHNDFEELIKEMAHENLQLEALTQGNLDLEPIRRERGRDTDTKYWKAVRGFATRLYGSLMTHWPCTCRASHMASLRLDIRSSSSDENGPDIKFGVIFVFGHAESLLPSTPWNWRNTEIRCIEIGNEYAPSLYLVIH